MKKYIACAVGVVLVGAGVWFVVSSRTGGRSANKEIETVVAEDNQAPMVVSEVALDKKPVRRANRKKARTDGRARAIPSKRGEVTPGQTSYEAEELIRSESPLTPEDRKRVVDLQKGLDEDNFETTRAAAIAALTSANPDVRQRALEAVSWFGKRALPELVKGLSDPNADVAETAMDAVQTALMEMEDDAKLVLVRDLLNTKGICSEDGLTGLVSTLQCIGMDDAYEVDVVRTISDLLAQNANPEATPMLKDSYEFITGDEYTGAAAAQKWVAEKTAEKAAEKAAEALESAESATPTQTVQ